MASIFPRQGLSNIPTDSVNMTFALASGNGEYDLNDRTDLRSSIVLIDTMFIVLIGVIVSLRFFTRGYIVRCIFLDDSQFFLLRAPSSNALTLWG